MQLYSLNTNKHLSKRSLDNSLRCHRLHKFTSNELATVLQLIITFLTVFLDDIYILPLFLFSPFFTIACVSLFLSFAILIASWLGLWRLGRHLQSDRCLPLPNDQEVNWSAVRGTPLSVGIKCDIKWTSFGIYGQNPYQCQYNPPGSGASSSVAQYFSELSQFSRLTYLNQLVSLEVSVSWWVGELVSWPTIRPHRAGNLLMHRSSNYIMLYYIILYYITLFYIGHRRSRLPDYNIQRSTNP